MLVRELLLISHNVPIIFQKYLVVAGVLLWSFPSILFKKKYFFLSEEYFKVWSYNSDPRAALLKVPEANQTHISQVLICLIPLKLVFCLWYTMCLLLPVTPCVVPLCVSGCCGSCCCPWCFCACCWSLSSSCWCWRCVSGFRAAGTLGGREMVVPRWPSSTPTAMPVAGGKGCSGVQSGLYRTGKADEYILMTFFFF